MKHLKQTAVVNDEPLPVPRGETTQRSSLSQRRENTAAFTLADGYVCIRFRSPGDVLAGDLVELYAGDYLLGSGAVEIAGDTSALCCNAAIDHAPSIAFPASVRAVLPRLNKEVTPGLTIPTLHALQESMGRHGLALQLAYVQERVLGFEAQVDCLPEFPRSLTLHLSGRQPSRAISEVPKCADAPQSLVHVVAFALEAPVRDGMSIEIVDDATGSVVYETTLTWMNLINPVLAELRNMHQQQEALTRQLDGVRAQIVASADPGRERLLLQRLDLTYLLLNERLDREMKWLSGRIDGADGEKLVAERLLECTDSIVHVSPSGLQGVGIFDSESNGVDAWRWFSRTVTLFLTQVAPAARALRFHFNPAMRELDLSAMNVSVNGYEAPFEWSHPEGKVQLIIGLNSLSSRPDRTLILTIDFGRAWSPDNDSRMLRFACLGLDIDA